MKKARFWALLMTAVLVFSTLSNDYIVASASEGEPVVEEEEPVFTEADGYSLTMVDSLGSDYTDAGDEGADKESEGSDGSGADEGGAEGSSSEPGTDNESEGSDNSDQTEQGVEPVQDNTDEDSDNNEDEQKPQEPVETNTEELTDPAQENPDAQPGAPVDETLDPDNKEKEVPEEEETEETKEETEEEAVKTPVDTSYTIKWVEVDENGAVKSAIKTKTGEGKAGDEVSVEAEDKKYEGYEYAGIDPAAGLITLAEEKDKNVITISFKKVKEPEPEPEKKPENNDSVLVHGQNDYKVKYSVGGAASEYGGSVRMYPENGEKVIGTRYRDLDVESYTIEKSSAFLAKIGQYTGYDVEWDSYEWTSSKEVHINGSLVGNVTVQYVDADNRDAVLQTETITGRFNYLNGNKVTASPIDIPGYTYVGNGNESTGFHANAEDNVIKLRYSRSEDITYTVQWIDVDTDEVFKTDVRPGGKKIGAVVRVSDDERKGAGTPAGYVYLEADPEYAQLTLAEDSEKNVIKMFYKKLTGYSVHFYYEDENGNFIEDTSETVTEEKFKSGDKVSYEKKVSDKKTVDGISYTLDKTKSRLIIESAGLTADDNRIEVYYSRANYRYRVSVYYENASHDGFGNPVNKDYDDGRQGTDLDYTPDQEIVKDNITYRLIEEDSITHIDAGDIKVSNNAGDNVIKLYYKRANNEVWFSILYPGEGQVDYRPQNTARFYPTRIQGQGYWKGTADFLDDGTWYVYNWENGINFSDYNIQMSSEAQAGLDAYLAEAYPGQNVHVVWYNYKNDNHEWGKPWYVNGYVVADGAEELVLATYDQNFSGGTVYKDTEFKKGANYTILGSSGDNAYGLTQREGYTFLGWSENKNAETADYQPGQTVEMNKAYTFYAVWQQNISGEITVTAATGSKTYDGKALTDSNYTVSGDLPEGLDVRVTVSGDSTITDVGTTANRIESVVIKDSKGEDVTSKLTVNKIDGTLTVLPALLTIKTGSASKTYDSNALTEGSATISGLVNGETASVTATGSITEVGSTANTYRMDWGTAKKGNYSITEDLGTLAVKKTNAEIKVTVTGGTYRYDGMMHTASVDVTGIPAGYSLADASSSTGRRNVGTSYAVCDTLRIVNAGGKDVTADMNITYDLSRAAITVTPAPVTIVTGSASKVYDGSPLSEASAEIRGLAAGETASITATGSITEVGTAVNTYSVAWNELDLGNYTITERLGTLKVTESSATVTVAVTGGTHAYDGKAHGAEVQVIGLPAGYSVRTAVSNASITNVGYVDAVCDELQIVNLSGEDVTSRLNIVNESTGRVAVTPAVVTVTTGSAEKKYDGKPLTENTAEISGLIGSETAKVTAVGTITGVGVVPNDYSISWGTADPGNYTVVEQLGTLTVTTNNAEIKLIAASDTKVYDGQPLTADKVSAEGLPAGFTFEAKATGSQTDVGTGVNEISPGYIIKDSTGADVTSSFTSIETVSGELTVTGLPVTITTGSASRVYDGTPLTRDEADITGLAAGETAQVTATGTITEVGKTENTYTIDWGTLNKDNYEITEKLGTLEITESNEEILVTVVGGTYVYDGKAHGAVVYVGNNVSGNGEVSNLGASVGGLPAGYSVREASSDTSLTNVGSEDAKCDKLVIVNASGEDVTSRLNIRYDLDNSELTVTPAPVTAKTESASRYYNGKELTAPGSVNGLAGDDNDKVVFTITGSQTKVGSSINTYTIDWGDALAGNYTVIEELGTLTVKRNPEPSSDEPSTGDTTGGEPVSDPGETTPTPASDPTTGNNNAPTPVVPTVTSNPEAPSGTPTPIVDASVINGTPIADEPVPLANPADVLGASRGIEADASSILGARVAAANAGVLGARRDAQTSDSNQMALYLILMGIATGVGGAYVSSRKRHEHEV